MTDRRLTPANARVALAGFAGEGQRIVLPEPATVTVPVADLRAAPGGARERQLLWGDRFDVLERRAGWAFGVSRKDGYVGYVAERDLGAEVVPDYLISARATHLYPTDDMKSEAVTSLSFGSRVRVVDERRKFMEIEGGLFVPKPHLRPLARPFSDPVTVAQLFFGTPYLWGGNSAFGIDCSGTVQAALLACGIDCPGDSDLQQALGAQVAEGESYQRGDLLFWKGHVAICVDDEVMLHANAHHMAVAYEPIGRAIARIAAQGDGPVIAHRRLEITPRRG
ncbi:NlpC/P60 family protein [Celeribacter indicus]|uniref:NlpC/P60 domain-containing protein n=1 Tax=Celeribacter indicus TaxID=1208324 RepID=A0A0B5DNT5_9RHOB|nr:NlpC/P60 family protein [Celeribacter indicus]AJE45243.1 NlpC/P60 domain-containing protein [Celeribacter indicus]SDX21694.1 NlpC/P60 family protein [Celeribacter indicus]